MHIIIFISFITITSVQTESINCFPLFDKDNTVNRKIDGRISNAIPDLQDFRPSEITKLTPKDNKKFGFDLFSKHQNNPIALFIISPDGISKTQGNPLMRFVNTDQEFHEIKQITHINQNKLDAVEIQYQKWLAAHQNLTTEFIQPLLAHQFECNDFEGITKPMVKLWMEQTLDHALSLKQNVVWMDAMTSDKYFAKILKKVRKANYQMKFIFVVGDKETVVSQAKINKKNAMMKYDKSQYYDTLLLIKDIASDMRLNDMSEDMQCIMSNGEDAEVTEIDYEAMNEFIKSNTKRTWARRIKSWFTEVGTGIQRARPFRTDPETQLKKSKIQSMQQLQPQSKKEDQDSTSSKNGRTQKGRTGKPNASDSSSDSDEDGAEGLRATGFLFWLCLAVLTVFMSIFGVIL